MNTPRLALSLTLSLVASAAPAQVVLSSTTTKLAAPVAVKVAPLAVPAPAPAPAPTQKAVTTAIAMPTPLPVMKTDVMPATLPVVKTDLVPKLAMPVKETSPTLTPLRPTSQPTATLTPLSSPKSEKLPTQAADAPGVQMAPGLKLPESRGADLAGAKIDASSLKQDMKLDEMSKQGGGKGMDSVRAKMMGLGGEEGKTPGKSTILGDGKSVGSGGAAAITDAVGEGGPIEGSKYGDTFGGQRVNGKQQGGKNNFAGNGKGRTSQGGDDEGGAPAGTIAQMLTDSGGKPSGDTGKDAVELQYAMSVGTDGYAATKDMSTEERKGYWEAERNRQLVGSDRPREDDNPSGGSGAPMGRQDIITQERGLAGKRAGAGGADDGRTDQQTGGGSNGQMIARGLAGAAEREAGVGTLNMDAVLKINQVARPVENQ
jgi:hypothetical protein